MAVTPKKMAEFVALLARHTPREGLNDTGIDNFFTYRETAVHAQCSSVYEPGIAIIAQGKKHCYVDGKKYDYSAGKYLTLFLPLPVAVEVVAASAEEPLLMAGIKIDLIKIANILVKMDMAQASLAASQPGDPSAIFARPLTDNLLDPILRLLRTLDDPVERAVLGEAHMEEVYFRLIRDDHTGALQRLLQHQGQVQQISKVVDHIHQNLDRVISVAELAGLVNMSASSFRKTFREVMHMPPLQYTKSIKLSRAQLLIQEGKNVSEAGYLVGYNSPAQFSREYKRHFGYSPSAT